ncbi:MAG: hypothetical protein LBJ38_03015, partial [Oscillospiraceae bacterium]|jgi:hypothetical protein|nr:hypothetical protein [Oscillospiraceae bacterium]
LAIDIAAGCWNPKNEEQALQDIRSADCAVYAWWRGFSENLPLVLRTLGAEDAALVYSTAGNGSWTGQYTEPGGYVVGFNPYWRWILPAWYWDSAPLLLHHLWDPSMPKQPPADVPEEPITITEVVCPPPLWARGVRVLLQWSAGLWDPGTLAEAQEDLLAAIGTWHNWVLLFKLNIVRNLAKTGTVATGPVLGNYTVLELALPSGETDYASMPTDTNFGWQYGEQPSPCRLLMLALCSGPNFVPGLLSPGFYAEESQVLMPHLWPTV